MSLEHFFKNVYFLEKIEELQNFINARKRSKKRRGLDNVACGLFSDWSCFRQARVLSKSRFYPDLDLPPSLKISSRQLLKFNKKFKVAQNIAKKIPKRKKTIFFCEAKIFLYIAKNCQIASFIFRNRANSQFEFGALVAVFLDEFLYCGIDALFSETSSFRVR